MFKLTDPKKNKSTLLKGAIMRKKIFAGVIVCSLLFISTACDKGEKTSKSGGGSDTVVAKINNEKITLTQFNERLKEIPQLAHSGGDVDLQTKKGFLDNLIVRELLYQEALKSGIDKEKDTSEFIEEMKKRVVVERFFKKEIDEKAKVSEEDLKKYYNENPEEAKNPVDVRVAHILVKSREEADMIKNKIKSGARFEDMAKAYSIDPGSKVRGGDLGFFSKGMMVPEFEDAAFKLKKGEVSDLVQTRYGFHIIKLIDKKEGKTKNFEEVKKDLENKLITKRRKDSFDSLVAGLKSKAKITINEDLLKQGSPEMPQGHPELK